MRKKTKISAKTNVLTGKAAYLYVGPFIVFHLILTVAPAIYSLILSLFQYRGYGKARYVGFQNYINLLKMQSTWRELGNTLFYYVAHLIPCLIFGFCLAYAVYSKLRDPRIQRVFKPIYYLPQMCSTVACSLVFNIVFGTNIGVVNQLLGTKIPFLTNSALLKLPVVVAIIWRTSGWYFLILLSGMTTVSNDLIEASVVDGANSWQQVTRIIVPIMKPIFAFLIITETMSSLKIWTEPALIAKGLSSTSIPIAAAPFVDLVVSNLQGGQFGVASAAGWLLFVLILIFTLVYQRLFNERL